ncbi:MAG TPA: hypothetical protein VHV74_27685 [Pseudonocardiaceae bacterium]|nr:hypothetical protein [Pseudonocardiaceae bacterium]
MGHWFYDTFVHTGRLPLLCFFLGMIVGFGFIRLSVRLIRAQVKWWPGNVSSGGAHIHHAVFGVVFMMIGGGAGLAIPDDVVSWRSVVAALFGIGAALVLDEFALILDLRDVYWTERGRISVDAVFVAVSVTGLLVLGMRPALVDDIVSPGPGDGHVSVAIAFTINLVLAVLTLAKGKIWTGLLGLFVPVLLLVGAIRLARPHSPWARWRYGRKPKRMARAQRRKHRLREPVIRAKIRFQEFIAGRPEQI